MEINLEYADLAGPYFAFALISFLALLAAVRRQKRMSRVADPVLLSTTWLPERQYRRRTRRELFYWFSIGLLLTAALLRPQWGYVWRETSRRGVDLVIAVDVSESMMSADVPPSRLARARYKIRDLLQHLQGDRISLVAFAGIAFIEAPLTVDYGTFRLFLDSLSPDLIPIQGTNIQAALEKSLEALGYQDLSQAAGPSALSKSQAILLITDGEDFEGDFSRLGEFSAAQGVQIYIIGIGTKEGGPIPVGKGFKRDKEGKLVVTRLNEAKLIELARQTGGIYVQAIGSDEDITTIYDRGIRSFLESRSIEGGRRRLWNERFQLPLLLAIVLLLFGPWGSIAAILAEGRTAAKLKRQTKSPLEGREAPAVRTALFLLLVLAQALAAGPVLALDAEAAGYQGKQELVAGRFESARQTFQTAIAAEQDDPRIFFGLGESSYRLGRFKEAAESFAKAARSDSAPAGLRAAAKYNLGNTLVQLEELKEAIAAYEAALKLRPSDQETIDNLAYARRLSARQKKEQAPPQKQQEQKQDKNPKQKENEPKKKNPEEKDSENKDPQNKDPQNEDRQNEDSAQQEQPQEQDQQSSNQENQKQEGAKKDQQQNQDQQQEDDRKQQKADSKSSGSKSEQNNLKDQDQQSDERRQNSSAGSARQKEQDQSASGEKDQPDQQQQSEKGRQDQPEQQEDGQQEKQQHSDSQQQQGESARNSGDRDQGDKKQQAGGGQSQAEDNGSGKSSGQQENSGGGKKQGDQAGTDRSGSGNDSRADGKADSNSNGNNSGADDRSSGSAASQKNGDRSEGGPDDRQPGRFSTERGAAEKSAGRRSGDGSDAAGQELQDPRSGNSEDPASGQENNRLTHSGEKERNSGLNLQDRPYASAEGSDQANLGGEGATDHLAQKEGPGDHSSYRAEEAEGSEGASGGKDGAGTAKAAVNAFLENVGEERGLYRKFREKKGMQQLQAEGRAVPEKDW